IGAQPRLWTCRDPQRHEPFPLDLSGSGEHSYGCPFGPPRIAEVWQHQRSWFGPNGQPPESSQLARVALQFITTTKGGMNRSAARQFSPGTKHLFMSAATLVQ